ncbi:MAG: DUF692 family protein [Myxococcota bacterium]
MKPRGLGLGLDLPWRGPYGIVGETLSPRTLAFLDKHGHRFDSAFVSWQPRDRGVPEPEHVFAPWDAFFARLPHAARCLHQTGLNLAAAGYDRGPILELTNALIARYGFAWVNEDLGSWSVAGWPLPYPQPTPLTPEAVDHCAAVCAEVDAALDAPLVVEFPGYEAIPEGPLDAYGAFRTIVERSGCACNLDTGHLLTWRWLRGFRGADLLGDLELLPLDRCVEIHCAGVALTGDSLIDAHHGVLIDIQLELAARLMDRCPHLRLVTYEDPRFDERGDLPEKATASLDALEALVHAWTPARAWPEGRRTAGRPAETVPWTDSLQAGFLGDDAYGRRCRAQVLDRQTRGLPRPRELYADVLMGDGDAQVTGFLESAEGRAWSDFAWAVPGRALEDALGRHLSRGSPAHLLACARLLLLHPDPPFAIPEGFRRAPQGWFAVGGPREAPVLYAAVEGRLVTGPITPLLADLLDGARPAGSEPAVAKLVSMGLLAPVA